MNTPTYKSAVTGIVQLLATQDRLTSAKASVKSLLHDCNYEKLQEFLEYLKKQNLILLSNIENPHSGINEDKSIDELFRKDQFEIYISILKLLNKIKPETPDETVGA